MHSIIAIEWSNNEMIFIDMTSTIAEKALLPKIRFKIAFSKEKKIQTALDISLLTSKVEIGTFQ